jgi:hypothetical protein
MLAPLPRRPSRSERHTSDALTSPSWGSVAVAVKVTADDGSTLAKSAGALMLTTGRLLLAEVRSMTRSGWPRAPSRERYWTTSPEVVSMAKL